MFYNPFYQETVSGNLNQKQMNNPTTSASAEESDLLDDITDQSQNISNNEICPTEVFTNPFKNEGDKVRIWS